MLALAPTKTPKRFLISPPFGNWITHQNCTRVMGSYTLQRRGGLLLRVLKTLRPLRDGWVNDIGLRNPGIRSVTRFRHDRIYSLVGLSDAEWDGMLGLFPAFQRIELNLGCPNVHKYGILPATLRAYTRFNPVIAKLPPTLHCVEMADMAVDCGVKALHLSNTLPSERGGISGYPLKRINLTLVSAVRARHPTVPIIAGGGIYNPWDVTDYWYAGADAFSLSTVWFDPWAADSIAKMPVASLPTNRLLDEIL